MSSVLYSWDKSSLVMDFFVTTSVQTLINRKTAGNASFFVKNNFLDSVKISNMKIIRQ